MINELTSSGMDPIELFNPTTATVDLSGWSVTDESPEIPGHRYTFLANDALLPNAYYVLRRGTDHDFPLGNDNAVRLLDASGLVVDLADYGPGEAVISYCRIPNGTGFFQVCPALTIGLSNDPPAGTVP